MKNSLIYLLAISFSFLLHLFMLTLDSWKFLSAIKLPVLHSQKQDIHINLSLDQETSTTNHFKKKNALVSPLKSLQQQQQQQQQEILKPEKDLSQIELYLSQIRQLIESHKFYPAAALKLGMQGEIILKFSIERNGTIKDITFLEKSPFNILNVAAKDAILKVGTFPEIPNDIIENNIVVNQKISFKLK